MTVHAILSWSPAAIVFDCDGTLMDSERHWQDARTEVFREFGLKPLPGFAERAKGVYYTECAALMAREAEKPELAEEMAESLLKHFKALVEDDPVTLPGAARLVRLAAGAVPLAVASNCPLDVVETSLGRAGLLRHFGHVVVPTEALLPKPRPDLYAAAARLCGVAPADALAVEDSATGIRAARRAGLRVLGVGRRPDDARTAPDETADAWTTTLADPRLMAWAHGLAARGTGT